ncbi:MAG TPA: helix-turn-helix domain-containing protein [Chloroflexota bacterium]|jgi:hypothetical protein
MDTQYMTMEDSPLPVPDMDLPVPATDGRWLTVKDAATLLDISERSVRRHVQHGQIRHRFRERMTEVWIGADTRLTEEDQPDSALDTRRAAPGRGMSVTGIAAPAPVTDSTSRDAPAVTDTAVTELANLLREERERTERVEQQMVQAREAAAMWQERARNLEAQVEQMLALPMHDETPEATHRWWAFWRRG